MERYLYSEIASAVAARRNCIQDLERLLHSVPNNNETITFRQDWIDKHEERIESLVSEHMPSGSGFDSGTKLDLDASHADKLVFTTSFHHMDEMGGYDGWTEHTVVVTPSFVGGFNMRISGRNRNDIKEYIGTEFHYALNQEVAK